MANTPKWNPNAIEEIKDEEEEEPQIKQDPDIKQEGDDNEIKPESKSEIESTLLSFKNFDLKNVLRHGGKLVGSAGQEYDDPFQDLDPVARLKYQKQNLKNKLGMGSQYLDDDLLNDADLADIKHPTPMKAPPMTSIIPNAAPVPRRGAKSKSSASPGPANKSGRSTPESPAVPVDPAAASNARLRAMARRKAKHDAKQNHNKVRVVDLSVSSAARHAEESSPVPTAIKLEDESPTWKTTDQEHNDKVVVEHQAPKISPLLQMQGAAGAEKVWPFEGLCELLMVDLFDPAWEVRHGAVLGLREVIKVHGAGAGRVIGKSLQQNNKRNHEWLEDLSCRLCCIFALDRFGDYVADQVVAPVRESAAQTLGALLLHLPEPIIKDTFNVLCSLVLQDGLGATNFPLWEACHGGMLGLRYLVSVRTDILFTGTSYLDGLIKCVLHGLQETDDDVQAMSAATLIPIASELVKLRPQIIPQLLEVIWNCLGELKDDLSASIGNVMDLLAKLCAFPEVLDIIKATAETDRSKSFTMLVPRLCPFLRHSITNVRTAVLRALQTFLAIEGHGTKDWIDARILRLVFQNLLVEQNEQVLNLSLDLWNKLLDQSTGPNASFNLSTLFGSTNALAALTLLMTPIGAARHSYKMDTSIFIKPSGAPLSLVPNGDHLDGQGNGNGNRNGNGNGSKQAVSATGKTGTKRKRKGAVEAPPEIPVSFEVNIDSPILSGDVTLIGFPVFLRTKITASRGFGRLLALWDPNQLTPFIQPLTSYLSSSFSTQRLVAGIILEEYGTSLITATERVPIEGNAAFKNHFLDKFTHILNNEAPTAMYRDFTPYIKAVRTQCLSLFSIFVDSARLPRHKIPQIAVVVQGEAEAGPDAFSIETAENIAGPVFEKLKRSLSASYRITYSKAIEDAHRSLMHAISEAKEAKTSREISIMAATAAAFVSMSSSLPKKLNPIIRSLMDSIKGEEHPQLQVRAAASVASLVTLFLNVGKTGASDKVIKNLCSFLCVDTSEVPEFHPNQQFTDKILSLRKEEAKTDPADIIAHQKEVKAARIKRLGAKTALENLAHRFGADLFTKLPKLKECMFEPLPSPSSDLSDNSIPDSICDADSTLGQDMIDALSVIRALLPSLHKSLHSEFLPIFQLILKILKLKYSVLRYSAAKCFATVCSVMPIEGMTFLVEHILPAVPNAIDLYVRQGAIECIYHLTATMGSDILPYVVFLIVPVLGRMSDADKDVRLIATTTFASIIKLVPLESGIPDPPGMPAKLLEGRDREREFISQMLDVSKVQNFPLPVAIKANLRAYQQEGVNWLAFLNKYHLHGILCDDMGLGKSLQTICIVASDHHLRAEEHAKTGSPETRKLPSLIVCPPTLTGHWMHELKTFAPFLKVLCYVGIPSLRMELASTFMDYDVVVTSYDITRNDIRLLAPQSWNYCVLDEGHIIKNAASKLTQAVKTLVVNHRLVLSGTPIQNNVLELWSLFDFLMPGFLGTEKVFNDRFAKPIAASRNSKSSSKEQEAGALALEALHKQVLPFLLRRLKEDVLSDLPPKIIQDYYCDLSDLQKQLYETFAKKQKPSISGDMQNNSKEGKQHIFQALQYMRKLCNHPALVLNPKHPQYEIVTRQLQAKHDSIRNIHHAPKLMALQALLKDCGIGDVTSTSGSKESQAVAELTSGVTSQHRALIFCQLKDMLDMVENDLLKKCMPSVTYMRLDGSTDVRRRHDIVQKFNGDPSIDVLLLTTHVGGLGLNLTGADTVIFVEHDWNPMNDLQAMDRAHRIGQKKVVNVYRLITRNTLEEKIMGLQKFKLNIASTVINQQNSGLASMDTDQLLDLFDVPEPGAGTLTGGAATDDDALDETGQIKNKSNAPNPIAELGELWDEKEYEEEYNLDTFIQSLQM